MREGRFAAGSARPRERAGRPGRRRAGWLMLLAWLPGAALAAAPGAADPPLTLETLMHGMASTTGVRADFREEKQLALLDAPLVSEGVLYFVPPARLARVTTRPGSSSLVIDGGRLSYTDETGNSGVDLAGNRVARTLVENFVVLFAGDLPALRERYHVEFATEGVRWRMRLVPRAAPLSSFLASIELRGQDRALAEIDVRESDGDRTVTRFERVETDARFSPEELARLFPTGASVPRP